MNLEMSDLQVLLAIDTSGPRLQLALRVGKKTKTLVEDIQRGHAEILFDRLADFLNQNQVAYADISKIIVTTGPGSFTGLRVGIAAARGLGLALDRPVIGVPNLLALSLEIDRDASSIVVDARRDQYYAQNFNAPGLPSDDPELIDPETYKSSYEQSCSHILVDPPGQHGTNY